ncbi:hypothetical protein JZ751_012825 [Albula glossodonta]|uniref:PLA2c domain-containing protein n=1 Tax=Albula glossodonta TaxID=121402 RepID=A0A8T2N1K1_9TELE|nr:hypothetical protein JZ751_012825 [Albula glossodonta]
MSILYTNANGPPFRPTSSLYTNANWSSYRPMSSLYTNANWSSYRSMSSLYANANWSSYRPMSSLYANGNWSSHRALSSLYADANWSQKDLESPMSVMKAELNKSVLGLCSPTQLAYYFQELQEKGRGGQLVSFIDVLGLIFEYVIHGKKNPSTLSDQQRAVEEGQNPYPIYTAVNVKKSINGSQAVSEWCEFTPYEVGIPKVLVKKLLGSVPSWISGLGDDIHNTDELHPHKPSALHTYFIEPVGDLAETLDNVLTNRPIISQRYNFLRGFNLHWNYSESNEFLTWQDTHLDSFPNSLTPSDSTLQLVDSGFAMNVGFPPVMRPQRHVDLILSFNYSWNEDQFEVLKKTAQYCAERKLPFPHIDFSSLEGQEPRECYLFRDEQNPAAPIVLHFPLTNASFREYSAPGVKRVGEAELQQGEVDLESSSSPYRTANLMYAPEDFERLAALTTYNVTNNEETILHALRLALHKHTPEGKPAEVDKHSPGERPTEVDCHTPEDKHVLVDKHTPEEKPAPVDKHTCEGTPDGMRQHFKLGQALKKRYHGFLSEAYDRHQIVVNSTDIDRTLMSAAVNLAAMYPPNGSQIFNPNLHWQPIPIHTVQNETTLLKFPLSPCPRFQTLLNETKNTPEFINKSVQYKEFLQRLANDTGMESISLESVWRIYDTLFCEKAHNLSQPSWVTTEVMETLQQLNDFAFMCLFGIHNQEEKSRLQGGVLLKHILEHVTESAVSNSSKPLKMQAYSTHDITIVALQVALNVFNGKQPPYASCHIFELFQEDNGALHCIDSWWLYVILTVILLLFTMEELPDSPPVSLLSDGVGVRLAPPFQSCPHKLVVGGGAGGEVGWLQEVPRPGEGQDFRGWLSMLLQLTLHLLGIHL